MTEQSSFENKPTSLMIDRERTYRSLIEGVVDSQLFRHLYATDDSGEERDITEDGRLSCAFVVSSVLVIAGMLERPHATVAGTLRDLQEHRWVETAAPVAGSIVVWPANDEWQEHIGFYVDEDNCVSNSTYDHIPRKHGKTLKDGREPSGYLTWPTEHQHTSVLAV